MVELMVVVAVGGVLMAVAVPGFTSIANSFRLSSTSGDLLNDLMRARSEAIKRNLRVLACAPNVARTNCSTSTNWARGWLICYDANADGSCDTAPTDGTNPNPLVERAAITSLTLTGPATPIRFNADGTYGAAGAATVSVVITTSTGTVRTVSVAGTGFVSKQ